MTVCPAQVIWLHSTTQHSTVSPFILLMQFGFICLFLNICRLPADFSETEGTVPPETEETAPANVYVCYSNAAAPHE